MLIHVLKTIAGRIARMAKAMTRARSRRSVRAMLMYNDHLLRDIGLTRADVVACLSSPSHHDPVEFLQVRRERNGRAAMPWPDHQSLAA